MPCFTTALSFYDGYRHEMLPANLIQVSVGRVVPSPGWFRGPEYHPDPDQLHSSLRLNGITLGLTPMNS